MCGASLLTFRRKRSVPTGLVNAGNLGGQGSVIAATTDRLAVTETASRVLLNRFLAHTVVLSTSWPGPMIPDADLPVAGVQGHWHFREVRLRLDLSGGMEATMTRLGYKMRRNLRYYRRRAENDLGCSFLPELTPELRRQAVGALFDKGPYPTPPRRAWGLDLALQAAPGGFAMALQDRTGAWLSYVAGWREGDNTYVDWQINLPDHESASISTVMRAYLLEHEAARGMTAITFVGGTTPLWSRVCEPSICGDLFAIRKGVVGALARQVILRMSPTGQVANLHARTGPSRPVEVNV